MKVKSRKTVVVILVVLIAAVVVFSMLGGGIEVEMTECQEGAVSDYYTADGNISCGDNSTVYSLVEGKVLEVCVRENQQVKKGDIIARIDSIDYEYDLAAAKGAYEKASAELELSRMNRMQKVLPQDYLSTVKQEYMAAETASKAAGIQYESSKKLYQSGNISKLEYESSKSAAEQALAAKIQAKSGLDRAESILKKLKTQGFDQDSLNVRFYDLEEEQLLADMGVQESAVKRNQNMVEKCLIRAPKDGTVVKLPIKDAGSVFYGTEVVLIYTAGKAYAEADVLINVAPFLKEGDPVLVTVVRRGTNENYQGRIEQVYDYALQGVSSLGIKEYRVHVKVALDDNPILAKRDGYGVDLKFQLFADDKCLFVPASAVFTVDAQSYVYTVKGGKAIKKAVTLRHKSSSKAVIESGLSIGEEVISNVFVSDLAEGVKVSR